MDAERSGRQDVSCSVGELARASGLSVRMLRHRETLGLVLPGRTVSGHRRYGPTDVTRLYRALALRQTGLNLKRVAALLDRQDPDPAATLRTHLSELDEDLRLEDQAHALVELLHGDTKYPPGSRILEAGCGVGAQTFALASHSPEALITFIDTSADSLAVAAKRASAAGLDTVTFTLAVVFTLPHLDGGLTEGSFDHVFVCFLLEHLSRPVEALTRLRSMLKPGGTLTVIEGDHGSTYFHPDSEAAKDAIECQVRLQSNAGGDALIGRRLYPLLADAGYRNIAVSPRMVYVDATRPDLVDGFIRKTFTAMIEGVRESAIAANMTDSERFDAGVRDLHRTTEPDGVFCYTFFKATATA